jgi:GTPase
MEKTSNEIDVETSFKKINLKETQEKPNNPNLIQIDSINKKPEEQISSEKKIELLKEESLKELEEGVKEIRVAVIGNVDSGKSTLVGVLTKCVLDDGRGAARQLVFNFDHEKQNGRTSSIAHEIMGFKTEGLQVEPTKIHDKKNSSWNKILKDSQKIISIIDLCGHEKYLKTTIFGLTGLVPDYAMIIIGANMGVQRMTKEHLGIALALKIPIFIVITKIDIAPADIYKQTLDYISKVLKSTGTQKLPVIIRDTDDVQVYAESIQNDRVCPIFCVSNVTGEGIGQLRKFIGELKTRTSYLSNFKPPSDKCEFLIDGTFNVKGIGLVISGILTSGKVIVGQNLMLGPDRKGDFKQVTVKSIHYKRTPCNEITSGNTCCFHIKSKESIKQSDLRKGMILLDKESKYKPVWEFDAEVIILHHATTIKPKYQAVIHTGVVRQTAKVLSINSDLLRTGDRGLIRFRFLQCPEYLHEGDTILFREGRTRGIGHVKNLIHN